MSDIPPIQFAGSAVAAISGRAASQATPRIASGSDATGVDQVEISEVASALSLLEAPQNVRIDKVMSIREAIRNGTYETPDKIERTIDRLMEVLE